jgi:DNA topoisomerase IB
MGVSLSAGCFLFADGPGRQFFVYLSARDANLRSKNEHWQWRLIRRCTSQIRIFSFSLWAALGTLIAKA